MAKTSCKATVNFIDVTALSDADVTTQDNLEGVGDVSLLDEKGNYQNVSTTELNQNILDGIPNEVDTFSFPFFSSELSLADCTFANDPTIEVAFDDAHTSSGLTLSFLGEYPREIKVTWYYDTEMNEKIVDKTFFPDRLEYFVSNQIEHYKGIKIEFIKTMYPKRAIKLFFIVYGQAIVWDGEKVMKGSVHEEVDVTSTTIPINTADLTIEDGDNQFNIQNDEGLWKSIQTNQEVTITEEVDGNEVNIGTFYIDTWKSKDNAIDISMIDGIGYIDKTQFIGGMYEDARVEDIVDEIMTSAGYPQYVLADDLKDITLSGYLPIMTHREALQQVAFAIGATVDCSRGASINISIPDRNVDSYILIDRKFSGKTTTELDEYVSGVQITCKKYLLGTDTTEIYNAHLDAGTSRIEFSEPYFNLTCTGGTIVESGINYAVISVATAGDVVLEGIGYESTEFTIEKNVPVIEVGQRENIKSVSGLYLYNMQLLPQRAQQLLDGYSLRQKVGIEYLCGTERVGEWVGVQDSIDTNTYAITRINSQTLDLTGGYISKADCKGYSLKTSAFYYMGNGELLMDSEEGAII